jgi:hypothetical protein
VRWYDDDTLDTSEEEVAVSAAAFPPASAEASPESESAITTHLRSAATLSDGAASRQTRPQHMSPWEQVSSYWENNSEQQPVLPASATISTAETFSFSVDLSPMVEQCIHS